MKFWRKKKDNAANARDASLRMKGVPTVSSAMREKVSVFMHNPMFCAWMKESFDSLSDKIQALEDRTTPYTHPKILGKHELACYQDRICIDAVGATKTFVFEDYRLKDLSGDLQEAMMLAVCRYMSDRLEGEISEKMQGKGFIYSMRQESAQSITGRVYRIMIDFSIDNPAYEERKDW